MSLKIIITFAPECLYVYTWALLELRNVQGCLKFEDIDKKA